MSVFDSHMDRRRFLQVAGASALAGAVPTLAGCASFGSKEHPIPPNPAGATEWGRQAGEWIPSCCNMCGGQSGILAHVVNGVVEKIEPNHWNPNNYSNISTDFFDGYTEEHGCKEGGVICAKGNAGIMQLYDPDRVNTPLKRTNPNKSIDADPKWQAISWGQALDEIAGKLKALRDGGEAHKLLWFSEDHSFTHIQADFCRLFGTPNYSMHSNLCDVARKASFKMVMGHDRPIADFLHSKYILLFGWNPISAMKWVYLPRMLTRAIEHGARLVVVDPYLSDTAAKAQEWVSIRPGTDGALALAMGHVIIRESLFDQDFVKTWTVGFDEYAEYVKDKTPKWAEHMTSIKAKTIERLARELATTQPALVDAWSGAGHHSNGVQGGRAIALLNALLGAYDRPGTMMIPDKRGNKHLPVVPDDTATETLTQHRFDELERYPFGHHSGVYTQSWNNLAQEKGPYRPKMIMCVFQNLMMSSPGTETIAKALSEIETMVVIDTMMSETARLADYVLPGTLYLERYDLNTHWVTWPVVGLRQPVVKPLFGQLAEYETVTALGRRLNLKDGNGVEFFHVGRLSQTPIDDLTAWYEDYLSNELMQGAPKITLDQLKKLPGAVWIDQKGTCYEKYAEPLSTEELNTAWTEGNMNMEGSRIYNKSTDQGGKRIGTVINGKPVRAFQTPSGKVEFSATWSSAKTDADRNLVHPLPVYQPRDWQPSEEYPLYLINWKEASHTHTRTQNNAWLIEIKPANPLIIHPETANRFGLNEGDNVWLESPYGKIQARVRVSKRIHPEVVGLQHGFGHWALGKSAKGRGSFDGWLRPAKADPLSGQALHKECCVRVRRPLLHEV